MDFSLPGSSIHGIFQARVLEWGAIAFSQEYSMLCYAKSLQSCPTLCDPIEIWQPTRLPRPWDSPGKNTGVVCHFLLQCMKVKSESEVAQSCLTVSDPMDCSLLGSAVQGIFQARVLEWGAITFSGNFLKVRLNHFFYFKKFEPQKDIPSYKSPPGICE